MIKGFNRRVVIMKNTGSEYFDEAYFLVKENMLKKGRSPVEEAKKLIRRLDDGIEKKRFSLLKSPFFVFLWGCVAGIILSNIF
ncbi:MAG: hypothetical protein IKL05_01985 [Clostridia bacterium]|nr:hypothetical protein [Clostridia bacterium]